MSSVVERSPLEIRCHGVSLSPRERDETERTFWLTLGKYEPTLRGAVVTVSPAGGSDPGWLSCKVSAVDHHGAVLLVEGADRDVAACVARTLRRAEREMRRRSSPVRRRVAGAFGA